MGSFGLLLSFGTTVIALLLLGELCELCVKRPNLQLRARYAIVSGMKFVKESVIHASPERVFAFHELPDAFERLIPPWENAKIVQKADISKVGSRAIIEQTILWIFTSRWVAEHTAYDPPRMFEDTMISGPFRSWRHRHIIEPHPDGAVLRDEIEYQMPVPIFGPMAAPLAVRPKLEKMFEFRHKVTREWCEIP